MIFDAASEGTHVILGMLVVGLIFLVVILHRRVHALGRQPPRRAQARPAHGVLTRTS